MASILIMAKTPTPGRVKTRLCPPCEPEHAAAIARACLSDTFDAARACGAARVVLALDGEAGPWIPTDFHVVEQVGRTFNERLANAWEAMPEGGVQIGMDTPHVTGSALAAAFDAVRRAGSALGPANDGGWWLLGLPSPNPAVFDGVAMSTSHTGASQLARLHTLGYRPALLPTMTDIDTWDDARAISAAIPNSHTGRAVAKIAAHLRARQCVDR